MTAAEQRLEHLAQTCGPRVLAYLMSRVVCREDAVDAYSAVLTTTWRRISDVPVDDGDALAWMIAVARREQANQRRGEARRTAATERLAQYLRTASPASSTTGDRVALAIDELPADQRDLVRLVYWDGLTCEQAAVALGIRPAAARKRLQRGRDALRLQLAPARL